MRLPLRLRLHLRRRLSALAVAMRSVRLERDVCELISRTRRRQLERHANEERGAAALATADGELAAHQLDQLLDNRRRQA